MSTLVLVRHAQASFFAEDYDCLSELGDEQSRRLGAHWVRTGREFDAVFCGPRVRQRRTAEIVGECYRQTPLAWPEAVVIPELDEYDLTGIMSRHLPDLERADAEFEALVARYRRASHDQERLRNFQAMSEVLMRSWIDRTSDLDGVESWALFCSRVAQGLARLTSDSGRSRRIAAFTSGGFIGAAVQTVLGAPSAAALEINWRVRNTSLTEFVFTKDRRSLDIFNAVPHLDEPALVTYR